MRRLIIAWFIALIPLVAAAHGTRDWQCRFNGDCNDPLVCSAGYCRAQCMTDRDCTNGWVCRPLRLIDGAPGTALPAVGTDKNRCVPPGAENLGRVVNISSGMAIELLPVLHSSGATTTAVPAGAQAGSPGYAIPQGTTSQTADAPAQRTPARLLQAPVLPLNPGIDVRRVHRAGGLEFQRGERDDFLYMRREGGEWTNVGAGEITSEPAAIATPDGNVYVFGKGKDDGIWGVRCKGGSCGGWFPLGGVLTSAPTVAIQADGSLRVTATGTDGRPWFIVGDGENWSGWNPE